MSNTNTIALQANSASIFYGAPKSFLFLKSFWEFKLPCLFFGYYYYHYLSYYYYCYCYYYNYYVFKRTTIFTEGTSQPPATSEKRKQMTVRSEHLLR